MSCANKKAKPTAEGKLIGVLAGTLLFIIRGLRDGSIKSKPILNMGADAENYEVSSLESEIWKALNKCGIKEKK